ncbi:hypothetical protein P168DRAFT_339824 [Aspergillus campestris IBT 28561]|uniref:Uncharacterized protein n=1 Tax=Aspergillus campestris (strain IBT 28561) TaxID=1392248 RepID=A0A2I1D9M2_ASPC2|nr:uncharacterized protein P168DRAFT_339824 [Aspergillus campestris IBT 28561]PKY06575.1 hypothetical protein P168DRAFT_339824 [Aspergillus campestris IBT 28561]
MLSRADLLLLLLLSSWAAASRVVRKQHDGARTFPASECGNPCTVEFESITTTVTVAPPDQTVSVESLTKDLTFAFSPLTTVAVVGPAAQTFPNDDPSATPTITLHPLDLGSVFLLGEEKKGVKDIADALDDPVGAITDHVTGKKGYVLPLEVAIEVTKYRVPSQYSPYQLSGDSALVTLAQLTGQTMDQLKQQAQSVVGDSNKGITTDHLKGLLDKTGRNYRLEEYDTQGPWDFPVLASQLGVPEGQIGLCYARDDFTGNCVVYYDGTLKDYQAGTNAPEFTKDKDTPVWELIGERNLKSPEGRDASVISYVFAILEEKKEQNKDS